MKKTLLFLIAALTLWACSAPDPLTPAPAAGRSRTQTCPTHLNPQITWSFSHWDGAEAVFNVAVAYYPAAYNQSRTRRHVSANGDWVEFIVPAPWPHGHSFDWYGDTIYTTERGSHANEGDDSAVSIQAIATYSGVACNPFSTTVTASATRPCYRPCPTCPCDSW